MQDVSTNPTDPTISPRMQMPAPYRALFWVILVDAIFLTARAWVFAYKLIMWLRAGYSFSVMNFAYGFLFFHILLFCLSIIALSMRISWREQGTVAFYPTAMILCTLTMNMAAILLWFTYHGIGRP